MILPPTAADVEKKYEMIQKKNKKREEANLLNNPFENISPFTSSVDVRKTIIGRETERAGEGKWSHNKIWIECVSTILDS